MKDIKELIKDIEADLVIGLVLSVKHKRINIKQAKVISKDFLSGFPFKDYEDLFMKLYVLSDKHRIVRKVYVKYSQSYEEELTKYILEKMREQITIKDFEKAIIIAKGAKYG